MWRFRLKTLLILVFVVAASIAAYPHVRNYVLWYRVRGDVHTWAQNVSRDAGSVSPFIYRDYFGGMYAVSTAEPYVDGFNAPPKGRDIWWAVNMPTPHDPVRFFVMPPGIWVTSADEIVDTWDDNS